MKAHESEQKSGGKGGKKGADTLEKGGPIRGWTGAEQASSEKDAGTERVGDKQTSETWIYIARLRLS